ncbi:ATP-binding protein [Flavobacterium sp. NRK1]|uniref:hybrid sensor histidine kinase/response regulator n=1 Tax=Flavobacterium sp. NRK1 TaxID=2954929 RepID=UPI0020925A09|nr:ATP-binding protein [Flavobacterium sp. NRK1]MCO6147038.1 ATP-binding protein [Flavobacterium sp. NRK1]
MVQKPKAVKYKVIAGYVLLFAMAALSVWLVYDKISKIDLLGQSGNENKKIIRISNTITNLYTSEAIGRKAILTLSENDFKKYSNLIDSISFEIDGIKNTVEENQLHKFDSIQLLLNRKRASITSLITYRKRYGSFNAYKEGIGEVSNTKDSIANTIKPVTLSKNHSWQKAVDAIITPKLKDSLRRQMVSIDTFAMAYENTLKNILEKDSRVKYTLFYKEQKLLEENRIISEKLRTILSSLENEFAQKSYTEIKDSELGIKKTMEKIAWIGAIALLILIIFAWIIIRDLTINQNYRKQLEALNLENEELLRTKSMLMATVTHDLQTPLGSIIGFQELLKDSGVTTKQKQYLNNINESASYILKLVNDLLDFSRLENNRISIEKTGFNIKTLIENTCISLEPMALKKGIELNWDVSEELDANFISDPYRIKQVLTNLISNAIKFTPEGSVEIAGKIEDNNIHISVIDTGIGISKEKHSDVFKEFTQAHEGIEKKFGGTGLGLTISKKILELLGGTIVLESEEGQGSIFTIIIPCIVSSNNFTNTEVLVSHNRTEQYPSLKNKKILVIDDDMMQLTLMKELFINYPVIVTTEVNASMAISLLENQTFDLVLTDIQMPSLDGFELIKRIRSHQNEDIAKIPVIALSGKRDLNDKDFTDNGFNGHHHKPLELRKLINLITETLEGRRITHPNTEIKNSHIDLTPQELYNLKNLSQFTNNDPESLKTILKTFIESAVENSEALKNSVKIKSREKLAETAHKMIPMLKLMEVNSIVEMLIPLEEGNYNMDWTELENYIIDLCKKTEELNNAFKDKLA